MTVIREKVFAYITNGNRLLVFAHPDFPEAGIQVPAGSLEPGENSDNVVMREAFEETGLTGLAMVGYLGEQNLDRLPYGKAEIHHRRFTILYVPAILRLPGGIMKLTPPTAVQGRLLLTSSGPFFPAKCRLL